MSISQLTGIMLIIVPVAFNIAFFALASAFEYPAILRQPTDAILKKFHAGGRRLITLWYIFGMTSLLAIPTALLVMAAFNTLNNQNGTWALVSAIFGTLSGLVQAMGLFRWSFLVPTLAASYENATPAARDAIGVVFNAFHQYVGVAIGEHLGYLFTAAWTLAISVLMLGVPLFSPLLVGLGVVSAIGILTGMLEPAGWKPAGAINATAYIVWSVWMILVGLTFLFAR